MSLERDRRVFEERWKRAAARARGQGAQFREGSGLRSLVQNTAAGGATKSQHLVGLAKDFPVPQGSRSMQLLASALRAEGLVVIDEPHGTGAHVHAQLYRKGAVPDAYFRDATRGQRVPIILTSGRPRAPAPPPVRAWAARPIRW